MSEKNTFDYIDNDPLVRITLINPISNKRVNAYAYLIRVQMHLSYQKIFG